MKSTHVMLSPALMAALLAGGCAVGPNYERPAAATPVAYKEAAGWEAAAPNDNAPRGPWWTLFGDAALGELEAEVGRSNQTLKQAAANYEQARQIVRADRGTFFPTLGAAASAGRSLTPSASPITAYQAGLQGSWAPDFWGGIRRTVEADAAAAQASAANYAASQLSLQSTLAQDYIAVRALDEKKRLLDHAIEAYRRTVEISQNKFEAGVSARSDVISAQTQLDATRAQAIDVGVQRSQFEHAIAVLIGRAPGALSIAPRSSFDLPVPRLPVEVPSRILERRPDVAAAERTVAAGNARIGVQTAAYFPNITLSAEGGFEGSALNHLFTTPFRFWTLGADATETLVDFGQRRARVLEARAAYDADVASYRQTVLTAFQQVEDSLAGLHILEQEAKIEETVVTEATEATRITLNEYEEGTVDYASVVTAQETELTSRESALTILQSRLTDAVGLIEALGGNWEASDLPSFRQVTARRSSPPPQPEARTSGRQPDSEN